MIQRGVVEHITSFLKYPRTPWDHLWERRIEGQKLGFQVVLQGKFYDEQNSNFKPMLHNIALRASKPQYLSIIRRLHFLLSYYPLDSSFIQVNFPLMAQRHHCHLHKASFMQGQLALSFALVPFAQTSSKKSYKHVKSW